MMDFLFAYNHKPEMILYVASSFILSIKNKILACSNSDDLKNIIFVQNMIEDLYHTAKNANMIQMTMEKVKKYFVIAIKLKDVVLGVINLWQMIHRKQFFLL